MDCIRTRGLCFCLLAFWALPALGENAGFQPEASASIQATATVITPLGITETPSAPDEGWLLYAPDPEGVLIQVSVGGKVVDEFGASDDQTACDGLITSPNPHIAFVSCKRFADAIPNDTLAVVVTVVYPDN